MPVTIHLNGKFPITSAPTPIPDAELYEEKTLADGRKVWVSAPLPDKLVLVIPISHYVYAKHISPKVSVSEFMELFVEHVTNPPILDAEVWGESKYGYIDKPWKNTTLVFGKRDARVYVARHKEKNLGVCVRLDLNPRKLGPVGFKGLRAFLAEMFDIEGLGLAARMRRLDVAVDVVGLNMAEVIAYHDEQMKRSLYIGGDGQLETVYIHKKAAKTKMPKDPDSPEKPRLPDKPAGVVLARIYDRVRFAEVLGKNPPFADAPVTRIELVKSRFYDKNQKARLCTLPTMANPLIKLRAGYVSSQVPAKASKWRAYLAACRTNSPDEAATMQNLPTGVAEQFKQALLVLNPDLIEPEKTWKRWHTGLSLTGLDLLLIYNV